MIIYEDMSQRSLREFFSPASTSGNGSEDDSESEEEEEQQHAPSNLLRRSHGYKCYCNRLIVFCSVQAKSGGHYNKIAIWSNNMCNHRNCFRNTNSR